MKKILLSIMIIAVVVALAAGGTMAYFSASGELPSHITTAEIALDTGTDGPDGFVFKVDKILPGWSETHNVKASNASEVPLDVYVDFNLKAGYSPALATALIVEVSGWHGTLQQAADAGPLFVKTLEPREGYGVDVTMTLPETGEPQNALQGKGVDGILTIEGRASAN